MCGGSDATTGRDTGINQTVSSDIKINTSNEMKYMNK
jgi:hypothetical protein